jgi:hypothetical protein
LCPADRAAASQQLVQRPAIGKILQSGDQPVMLIIDNGIGVGRSPMENEIARIAGRADFFLAMRFQRHWSRLIQGSWRFAWIGLIPVVAFLTAIFMVLLREIDDELAKAAWLACYLFALATCCFAFNRLVRKRLRQAWVARGVPSEVELLFVVAPDGLHISSETGKTVIHWPYLSEIARVDNYWLIIGPALGLPLSRSFFATPAEERAFLSKVLERMTPAARTRSSKATTPILQA